MDETMGRSIQRKTEFHSHNPNLRWTSVSLVAHARQYHGELWVKRNELGFKGLLHAHEKKHVRHGKGK